MTEKTRVAVLYGGRSTEHSVSCVSAGAIMKHLDPEKFEVVPIGVTGIAIGVISWTIVNVVTGKAKEKKISPLMYVLTVLFILKYVLL